MEKDVNEQLKKPEVSAGNASSQKKNDEQVPQSNQYLSSPLIQVGAKRIEQQSEESTASTETTTSVNLKIPSRSSSSSYRSHLGLDISFNFSFIPLFLLAILFVVLAMRFYNFRIDKKN